MADLINISITVDQSVQDLIRLAPSLKTLVDTIKTNAVKGVGELALAAEKSKIPIDTLSLRGTNLNNGFLKVKNTQFTATVYIQEGEHTNRHGKKQSSTKLADILNRGIHEINGEELHRTRDSAAIGILGASPYGYESIRSETKDWEGKAFAAFISAAKLGAYLKNTDFIRNIP